jgi:hypothetical protein
VKSLGQIIQQMLVSQRHTKLTDWDWAEHGLHRHGFSGDGTGGWTRH